MLENPKILKLVVLVDSLYLEIREGSGAKNFKVEDKFLMYTM